MYKQWYAEYVQVTCNIQCAVYICTLAMVLQAEIPAQKQPMIAANNADSKWKSRRSGMNKANATPPKH
ncbi:MAG: hypothetical protein U5J95_10290 [Balneolaceae bacterium]|nr:hypothetical protein [Balneolaceae bacterium]